MKNLLIQWETEEINRKIIGNIPLIDRELARLENYVKCASLLKLTELIKKHFNLIRIEK